MRIGHVLKKYRLAHEWSLRDFAPVLGLSAATLMRIEKGHAPDAESLMKIFTYLTGPGEKPMNRVAATKIRIGGLILPNGFHGEASIGAAEGGA